LVEVDILVQAILSGRWTLDIEDRAFDKLRQASAAGNMGAVDDALFRIREARQQRKALEEAQ